MFKNTPASRSGFVPPRPNARTATAKSVTGPQQQNGAMNEAGFRAEVQRLIRLAAETGTLDSYGGKRSERRVRGGLPLEVTADPALGDDVRMVSMHDISGTGLALWSKTPMAHRIVVYVREYAESGTRPWLKARVSRCNRGIRGYLIGCTFEPPSSAGPTAVGPA